MTIDKHLLNQAINGKSKLTVLLNEYFELFTKLILKTPENDNEHILQHARSLEFEIGISLGDLERKAESAERLLNLYENVFNYANLIKSVKQVVDAYKVNPDFASKCFQLFIDNFNNKLADVYQKNSNVCQINTSESDNAEKK